MGRSYFVDPQPKRKSSMEIKAGNWYKTKIANSAVRYFLVTILDPAILSPSIDIPASYSTSPNKLHVTLRYNDDNSVQPDWIVFENMDWVVPSEAPGSFEVGQWFRSKNVGGQLLRIERFYLPVDGVGQRIIRLGCLSNKKFQFHMMSEASLRTFYVPTNPYDIERSNYIQNLSEARETHKDLEGS
jgi:hypothetical protein